MSVCLCVVWGSCVWRVFLWEGYVYVKEVYLCSMWGMCVSLRYTWGCVYMRYKWVCVPVWYEVHVCEVYVCVREVYMYSMWGVCVLDMYMFFVCVTVEEVYKKIHTASVKWSQEWREVRVESESCVRRSRLRGEANFHVKHTFVR